MPVRQYELMELKAEIFLSVLNRYNYDSIVFGGIFTGPDGDTVIVEGSYYQHFIRQGQEIVMSEAPISGYDLLPINQDNGATSYFWLTITERISHHFRH